MNESGNPEQRARSGVHALLPSLADHDCFIFFPIRVPRRATLLEAELTLQDRLLTDPPRGGPDGSAAEVSDRGLPWLPATEREALLAQGRETRIWEPVSMNLGPDLYPHVRRMLGQASASQDTNALCFRIADLPLRLLQGRSLGARSDAAHARRKLVLILSASARSRIDVRADCSVTDALEVHIEYMQLVICRTGIGIVIAQLALRTLDGLALPPYCLVEAVMSLARFNKLEWREQSTQSSPGGAPSFSLSEIVSSLHASEDIGTTGRRLFTATYAQFTRAPEAAARRHFALQLARHYSDDYRIGESIGGTRTIADFENVMHVISLEGCATILDLSPPPELTVPEFVRNFRTATFERTYLPIMVLAFHEFMALLHFCNDTKFWFGRDRFDDWAARQLRPRSGSEKPPVAPAVDREVALGTLARLRDDILRFRLCYCFSHVSYSTAHNTVYDALREVWGCRRMLSELAQDTAEITDLLDEHLREQNARRVRVFGLT